MSEAKNVRSRHSKLNRLSDPIDFQWKHDRTQITLMVSTALIYLLHTLRAYIPEDMHMHSDFWTSVAIRPITRVYTSDLRPNLVVESLLFRLGENWQTFWLIYVLSYIPRRTNLGYLYQYPNLFNSFVCCLLIGALSLQTISQLSLSPKVSCICLCLSLVLLLMVCRVVSVKLVKYESKYRSAGLLIDRLIIRYFALNSLFLYTTLIAYSSMCASVEYLGLHLDSNAILPVSTRVCTTVGLTMITSLLVVYFLLDRFVYENEFQSVWTPYLFIGYTFICPPYRHSSFLETDDTSNNFNTHLFRALFSMTVAMISTRCYRQMSEKKKNTRFSSK